MDGSPHIHPHPDGFGSRAGARLCPRSPRRRPHHAGARRCSHHPRHRLRTRPQKDGGSHRAIARLASTALNLGPALSFARQIQQQSGRRAGEVVFVGAGQTGRHGSRQAGLTESALPERARRHRKLRPAPHRRAPLGQRSGRVGDLRLGAQLRHADRTPSRWRSTFGPSLEGPGRLPAGSQRLMLAPGADRETSFQFRGRTAGFLQAQILPHDAFPADDRATLQLPAQPELHVTVYSAEPDLLRPVLAANPRVIAAFRAPAEYNPRDSAALVILDRFRPSAPPAGRFHLDRSAGGRFSHSRAHACDGRAAHPLVRRSSAWAPACAPGICASNLRRFSKRRRTI